jgi:hypothetical protein
MQNFELWSGMGTFFKVQQILESTALRPSALRACLRCSAKKHERCSAAL